MFCAMIDLSQAYDRININTLCPKLNKTELLEQISNTIEYMCRNTFVNTVYGGQPSEFWRVRNGTRQGGITFGILFNFSINEVLDAIMNIPVGCSLICSKMNILFCADEILLLTPTEQALQVVLYSLSGTIRSLSLKNNIKNLCHIFFPL